MKYLMPLLVVSATLNLAGCNDKTYPVDYYIKHEDIANDIIKKCETGDKTGDNCTNAKSAIEKIKSDNFIKNALR